MGDYGLYEKKINDMALEGAKRIEESILIKMPMAPRYDNPIDSLVNPLIIKFGRYTIIHELLGNIIKKQR